MVLIKWVAQLVCSLIIGILVGFVLGHDYAAVDKFEFGRNNGFKQGMAEAIVSIKREFGRLEYGTPYKPVFGIGPEMAVSVVTSGVKTIRIYE